MVIFRSVPVLILIMIALAACQPQAAELEPLPTLIEFPTETNTPVFTDTPTMTPTSTVTSTPTLTQTPSITPTPTLTRLPSLTPSFTPSNTPTSTATPTNTPLPTSTSLPDFPEIETFQSSVQNALPGEEIRLRWSVDADSARFEVLDATGNATRSEGVPLVGSTTVIAPSDMAAGLYRLVAIRDNEEVRQTLSVEIGAAAVECSLIWFSDAIPETAGCPLAPPLNTPLVYQRFERGLMFAMTVNGQQRVCGLQFDRNLYSCYLQQPYTSAPLITPAPGFVAVASELQHTYFTQLGTGGLWYQLLGQAPTSPVNTNVAYQTSETGKLYVQLPDALYGFDNSLAGQGQQFERITP